jgi:type IV pilus assembly protein PilY1
MSKLMKRRLASFGGGALLALASAVAVADDTEIFFNNIGSGGNANVMLILDTSGSMNDVVTSQVPYDSTVSYTANKCAGGNFDASKVYFGSGGTVPACGSANQIAAANFKCVDAAPALVTGPGTASPGYYSGSPMIQWGPFTTTTGKGKNKVTSTTRQWQGTLGITGGTDVECKNDAGLAGNGVTGGANLYPSKNSNATSANGIWDVLANSWWGVNGNAGGNYVIYSANYLNYYYDSATGSTNTKVAILQQGVASILASTANVNIGLMRYDSAGSGGMVQNAIAPIATNAAPILANVNNNAPSGNTPISETLYEAYLYFAGGAVNFGNSSNSTTCNAWSVSGTGLKTCGSVKSSKFPSVPASRNPATAAGTNYASPANSSCQKNFIVFLTDGLPNGDYQANTAITKLPNFASTAGSCYASSSAMYGAFGLPGVPTGTDGTGLCSAAIAKYMYKNDLRKDVSAVQNVSTFMIGFGNDFADSSGAPTGAFDYLQDIASKGGGKAFTATNLSDLTSVFNQILASVVKTNTMFSAPAVAVNAFNRTQTLNDLYVSVFSPKTDYHWPGNLKRYQVVNNEVVDANGVAAVDPATGFFTSTAQSFWSAAPDGFDVTQGGAASNIPDPAPRNVFTYIGANPQGHGNAVSLTAGSNSFIATNASLTTTLLNIGGVGDPSLPDLVNWARGQDLLDENSNGSTTDTRHDMGDPIHTAPAVVIYGKNSNGTDNTVAYVPTNDGYLHAVDANTGIEKWAFIPQEMLGHLVDLYDDNPTVTKHYGIDGAISVLKYDINGDGTVDPAAGDKVLLFFSTGRNTDVSMYYGMDVTDPANPALLWAIDGNTLPGLGQAWSQPAITRVNIAGATQNSQKLVLVIGGGYDPSEDGYSYVDVAGSASKTPEAGSHLFMIDALYGTLLWDAGGVAGYNFVNARMDHAIPSPVAVLDMNGDGYADRMYVGDMSGQVWRFDIINGNPAASLVNGGVIASLGTREDAVHRAVAARRFYNVPDVSTVSKPGVVPYLNIAIGSGYRGHPLDQVVQDRFYSVHDAIGQFGTLSQATFNLRTASLLIRDAEIVNPYSLVDVTASVTPTIPAGSVGWQLDMNQYAGWIGEKVLSQASTFNNAVIFTTYTPNTSVPADPCAGVGSGTNRVYVVNVYDGAPAIDRNKDGMLTIQDRGSDLAQGGIAPQTAFLFLPPGNNGGGPGQPPPGPPQVTCLSGVEVLSVCRNFNQRVKTYWREGMAN